MSMLYPQNNIKKQSSCNFIAMNLLKIEINTMFEVASNLEH